MEKPGLEIEIQKKENLTKEDWFRIYQSLSMIISDDDLYTDNDFTKSDY